MIRVQKWQGTVTYASPYLIPAGGATEQTNMVCLLPGQISCRGGMEKVLDTTGAALEMWGFSVGNDTDKIFIFTDSGDIRIEDAPAI